MTRSLKVAVAVAALGLLAASCSSSSKASSNTNATTTTGPSAPAALTVTATDYAYSGVPATMPAGITHITFVNKGTVPHEMSFLKVTNSTDTTAIFANLAKVFQGDPFPADFLAVNGVHDTKPGQTTDTQFNLTPGNWIALCGDTGVVGSTKDGQPHFDRGMYKKVTVTGTGGTAPPTAESTLTAHDYGFDVSGLKAGAQTIVFKNVGPVQWHFADIAEFPAGTTVAQATQAMPKLLASNGPPPAGVPSPQDVTQSQAASPGYGNTFTANLAKGRTYVVACFLSDKKGGAPHAISHHMYKIFTIS